MKNKGYCIIPVVFAFQMAFACVGVAALWHIPAWSKAKKEGKTAEYQKQKMFPQELFAKLPGGRDAK